MEILTKKNYESIKAKLFEIEEKFSKGIASEDELQWSMDVLKNSEDYSDYFIANPLNFSQEDTIKVLKEMEKNLKYALSLRKKCFKTFLLIGMRKPYKTNLESLFESIERFNKWRKTI
jgi:hypothetical protein